MSWLVDWSPLVLQAHLSLPLGCRAISGDPNCLQLLAWHFGFPGGSDGKASAHKAGDPCSIPGSGRSSGEGYGNPLQYSCLENSMDGGAWWATVHRVANSRMQLSDFTFTFFVSNPATRRGCVMHLDSYWLSPVGDMGPSDPTSSSSGAGLEHRPREASKIACKPLS